MGESRRVEVHRLGIVPYEAAIVQMKALQLQRIENEIPDTLLILQHQEIVTVGPRARNDGIAPPPGYRTHSVDRGGGLTWHGPGQLVAYPIFKWDQTGETSVAAIIEMIESWVIAALGQCGIEGARDERMQGVWVDGKKISSIGLSFLRWTSRHGFTINFDTPIGRVEGLAGCGLEEQTTTCLQRLGHTSTLEALVSALKDTMEESVHRTPAVNRSIADLISVLYFICKQVHKRQNPNQQPWAKSLLVSLALQAPCMESDWSKSSVQETFPSASS